MATWYFTVWICHNLCDHSLIIGYWGAFFAIINYIAVNILNINLLKDQYLMFFETG